jgi:hypothetical protein
MIPMTKANFIVFFMAILLFRKKHENAEKSPLGLRSSPVRVNTQQTINTRRRSDP